MRLIRLAEELTRARLLSPEISARIAFAGPGFESGVVRFRPGGAADPKAITHADRDVISQVLSGTGRVRVGDEVHAIEPGIVCHIPAGTPHDFAATGAEDLVLFYVLVTRPPAPA